MRILSIACLAAAAGWAQGLTLEALPNPSGNGALQANWSAAPNGGAILSWIAPAKANLYELRYAVRRDSKWSEPRTVAANRHFFRHPAELPEVEQLSETLWLAHWVEMPQESSDAEFIYVSSSADGVHWTPPLMANQDRRPVQHGLVSMIGSGSGEASLFWLETPKGEDGPGYLMRSVVNASGKETKEEAIDMDVCSCCSTAVAKSAKGLIVAYRDHTPADIRDISVVRLENGHWTQPKNVHADNWKLDACPVNGPAIAAKGDEVVVSWFTAAQDSPRTEIAFSQDDGSTFGKTTVVSTGHSEGFTSVVITENGLAGNGGAIVSWIEQGHRQSSPTSRLLVRAVDQGGAAGPVLEVTTGSRTELGNPRLLQTGRSTLIAWGTGSKILSAVLKE